MDDDTLQADAFYNTNEDAITFVFGSLTDASGHVCKLDIRDAVYFRYLLDGAISDYEKAVGR